MTEKPIPVRRQNGPDRLIVFRLVHDVALVDQFLCHTGKIIHVKRATRSPAPYSFNLLGSKCRGFHQQRARGPATQKHKMRTDIGHTPVLERRHHAGNQAQAISGRMLEPAGDRENALRTQMVEKIVQGFDGVEVALVGCPNTGRGGCQGLHQADLDQVESIR